MKTWVFKFKTLDGEVVTKQFKAESKKQAEKLVEGFDILTGPELLKARPNHKVK